MTLNVMEKSEISLIRTPDQRLRVFISSTMQELSDERKAVRQAIDQLQLIPVFFESGARPHSPRELYRAYLSQSHIFIGIYWQSYGWVAPEMTVSGLEDEYRLSENLPRLIYIKSPAQNRDPKLTQLISQVKNEDKVCFKYFSSSKELENLVTADLILLLSERFERSQHFLAPTVLNTATKRTNLPSPITPFVGREQLVVKISSILQEKHVHLVTLTGPGGVGKTRLSVEVARKLLPHFQDGVWLAELAPLSDPSKILSSIAEALDLREENSRSLLNTLVDYFTGKQMLIVLDNCEHLVAEAARQVDNLLNLTPDIKFLVTSRESLGIKGEFVWSIPSLIIPHLNDSYDLKVFSQFESVKLFVERARAVRPDFSLKKEESLALVEILNRLDGIPLAIELAAARVRMLSLEEINSRLKNSFRFLTGNRTLIPRQQTLEAMFEWSYTLLSEKERLLLNRLAVFSNGWSLEAAEYVCAGGSIAAEEVIDLLCSLIEKSLIVADVQDCCERYKFLETIRQCSWNRLMASDEKNEYMIRHAEYFTLLAERTYGDLWGINQLDSLCNLSYDNENFRSALTWLSNTDGFELYLLRMTGSIWRFWEITGQTSEGRSWLELALAKNPNASTYLRANGLRGLANLLRLQGEYALSIEYHHQSLGLFEALGYEVSVARELNDLGEIEWLCGNYDQSINFHTKSLILRRKIDDTEGIAVSLENLGSIARDRGQYRKARELLGRSLALFRQIGDKRFIGNALKSLGMVEAVQSEYVRSSTYYEEALDLFLALKDEFGISNILFLMGEVAKDRGEFQKAVYFYMLCQKIKQDIDDRRGFAQSIAGLAEIALLQGRYNDSVELAHKCLLQFRKLKIKRGVAVACVLLAYSHHYLGRYEEAKSFASKGLRIAGEIKAPRAVAYSYEAFGMIYYAQGHLVEAEKQFQQALYIFNKYGDRRNIANTLVNLARIHLNQGDFKSAERNLAKSLSISRRFSIRWSLSYALNIMGKLQIQKGNHISGSKLVLEGLKISVDQENQQGIVDNLSAIAELHLINNQTDKSARLFAAAKKGSDLIGYKSGFFEQQAYDHNIEILRRQLGGSIFLNNWTEGSKTTIDHLIPQLLDIY